MELTVKQKLYLKSRAHNLKPVVMVGQKGITDNLIKEADNALNTHELIKIKIAGHLPCKTNSGLVQIVGGNATLFRKRKEKSQFQLPKE